MEPSWGLHLLRYGELGIKSAVVRRRFERQLVANLQAHFVRANVACSVTRTRGRIFLETPEASIARHAIRHTFGIVSGSTAMRTDATPDAAADLVRAHAAALVPQRSTFAVRARRSGHHAFSSVEVARACGTAVLEAVPEARVDLDAPDVEVHVEVRDRDAYLLLDHTSGPGGLPMGAQGRVVVPVLSPRSLVVSWFLLRRGARVHPLVPMRGWGAMAALAPWAPALRAQRIEATCSTDALFELAELVARRTKARAIGTELAPLERSIAVPTLHPLAGLPEPRWPDGARSVLEHARKLCDGPYTDDPGSAGADALLATMVAEAL